MKTLSIIFFFVFYALAYVLIWIYTILASFYIAKQMIDEIINERQ